MAKIRVQIQNIEAFSNPGIGLDVSNVHEHHVPVADSVVRVELAGEHEIKISRLTNSRVSFVLTDGTVANSGILGLGKAIRMQDHFHTYLITLLFTSVYPSVARDLGFDQAVTSKLHVFTCRVETYVRSIKKNVGAKGATRKQHFIPRTYLKHFENDSRLYCKRILGGSVIEEEVTANSPLFWRNYLHDDMGHDQRIEHHLARNIEPQYNLVTLETYSTTGKVDFFRNNTAVFFSYMATRHPDTLNFYKSQIVFQLRHLKGKIEEEAYQDLFSANLQKSIDNAARAYFDLFQTSYISFLYAPKGRSFISNDLTLCFEKSILKSVVSPRELWGKIVIPMSRNMAVLINDPEKTAAFNLSHIGMDQLNRFIASRSSQFIFGAQVEIDKIRLTPKNQRAAVVEAFNRGALALPQSEIADIPEFW